jgi:hypothetical protein
MGCAIGARSNDMLSDSSICQKVCSQFTRKCGGQTAGESELIQPMKANLCQTCNVKRADGTPWPPKDGSDCITGCTQALRIARS